MELTARASSFLPTIKCSNCSIEIPISQMGDHLCSQAPPLPESRLNALQGPFAPSTRTTIGPAHPKVGRTPPPQVNMEPISTSFPPPNQPYSSRNTASDSRSASPARSLHGRRSPYQMPTRSATTPLPIRPPSPPDLPLPQDSAFPPFPTSKSRSATPTTPVDTKFAMPPGKNQSQEQRELGPEYAPRSPRDNGGGSLMKRMDSIAPGPFNLREKGDRWTPGHKKSPSMGSSQDFIRPLSSGSVKAKRPSTSSSNYTRTTSLSSMAGINRFTRDVSDVPAVPSIPSTSTPSFPDESSDVKTVDESVKGPFDFGQPSRKKQNGAAEGISSRHSPTDDQDSSLRKPAEPSIYGHRPRPSVAAAMQPLGQIGSTSSFKPSKSLRGRIASPALDRLNANTSKSSDENDRREDQRLEDAPPVPASMRAQKLGLNNPYHTPHESTSSNESNSSGIKSGSSRSSPPLNDSPQRSIEQRPDGGRVENLFQGFQFHVEKNPQSEEPKTYHEPPLRDPEKADYSKPSHPSLSLSPMPPTSAPREVPTRQDSSPVTSPDDYLVSSFGSQSRNLQISPAPKPPPPIPASSPRRPTTSNKGSCRGCGELITGKSVSSADGRLTGRYHKQCFVCKTCSAPFKTVDFYVDNNHPYCARHYHELNGSLCKSCDRGIEGVYLQTELKQKFHPYCFTCQECHRILRDDYFEFNQKTLCEQHAFRAFQQPSSLGPGRRFPERRTTRLMNM